MGIEISEVPVEESTESPLCGPRPLDSDTQNHCQPNVVHRGPLEPTDSAVDSTTTLNASVNEQVKNAYAVSAETVARLLDVDSQ
jgi:hypothetical protein